MGLERKANMHMQAGGHTDRFYDEQVELTISLFGLGILVGAVSLTWSDLFEGVAATAIGEMMVAEPPRDPLMPVLEAASMLLVMREQFDDLFDAVVDEAIAHGIAVENGGESNGDNALAAMIAAMAARAVEEYENGSDDGATAS